MTASGGAPDVKGLDRLNESSRFVLGSELFEFVLAPRELVGRKGLVLSKREGTLLLASRILPGSSMRDGKNRVCEKSLESRGIVLLADLQAKA